MSKAQDTDARNLGRAAIFSWLQLKLNKGQAAAGKTPSPISTHPSALDSRTERSGILAVAAYLVKPDTGNR